MTITKNEVRANRQAWIDHLLKPDTKKHTGELESHINSKARCCLGHACHALIPDERGTGVYSDTVNYLGESYDLPGELVVKIGMYSSYGDSGSCEAFTMPGHPDLRNLTAANDHTSATPQDIGAYLQTVIEGGENTPFKPLSEYDS